MIIGLDMFGMEEFAHTKWFDIKDWVIPCAPTGPAWTDVREITGYCEEDNITDHYGCLEATPTREEQANAFRVWNDNRTARSKLPEPKRRYIAG